MNCRGRTTVVDSRTLARALAAPRRRFSAIAVPAACALARPPSSQGFALTGSCIQPKLGLVSSSVFSFRKHHRKQTPTSSRDFDLRLFTPPPRRRARLRRGAVPWGRPGSSVLTRDGRTRSGDDNFAAETQASALYKACRPTPSRCACVSDRSTSESKNLRASASLEWKMRR